MRPWTSPIKDNLIVILDPNLPFFLISLHIHDNVDLTCSIIDDIPIIDYGEFLKGDF